MTRHSRRDFLRSAGLGATAFAASRFAWTQGARARRPNIILFLVDDMGWMDTTVYGSQYYDTPNMERLAKRSMMFTNAYTASPLCSPTRGSIMTGKHPARLGITTAVGHRPPLPPGEPLVASEGPPAQPVLLPQSRRYLRPEEYTVAEALRDAGYATGHFGKWHLGLNPEHWPEEQGFQVSFHGAPDPGPPSYFSPYQFKAGTVTDGPEGEYIADRLTDEALEFMEAHRDEPFFLNLWHYSVHGPWGHKEELTGQYQDRVDPRGRQDNPIMASMLKSVDGSLGRVLDKLEEFGIADDTIVIFFSDNGGNVHSNTEQDAARVPEGSARWKVLQNWRRFAGGSPPTNNAPLRAGKGTIYEGGTRVPLMVCWAGTVESGSQCAEVVSSVDLYPTILEMVGLKPKPNQVLDGETIVPVLKQTGGLERQAIFCYFPHGGPARPPGVYVRKGDWKLIRWYLTSDQFPDEFELYNLEADIGETENRAGEMPERVKELNALIDEFLAATGALVPIRNPAFDPRTLPINGWRGLGETGLSLNEGILALESTGGRTQMQTRDVPQVSGPLLVKVRARSSEGGGGIFYWATSAEPQFARERRVDFQPEHDGEWHEYEIRFSANGDLVGLRYDGSTTPTTIEIAWLHLCDAEGTALKTWDFRRAPAQK